MKYSHVYPASVHELPGAKIYMIDLGDRDALVCEGKDYFPQEMNELTHETANRLRALFPFTAPVPVLNYDRSVGVGDRLGLAGPGHIRVFEKYDAMPVFAQQSIRELNLTNRTFEDVLDSATFAVFRENFTRGFGADGDHLKKPEDIEYALSLGFTMITLDLSEHIHANADGEYSQDVRELYLGKTFRVEDHEIEFTADELKRVTGIYGDALDFAVQMYDRFLRDGTYKAEFEISIDETGTPTRPSEHFFVANELKRRGVVFMTIAPRFIGEFQKGMTVYHSGTDKQIQLKQPQQFMADEREAVENAYAGDIIGLFDPGFFHLGDALSSGPKLHFSSIPVFAPEHFARVRPEDSMKRKQFLKGILQLAEEGAIQTFRRTETGREDFLVGVVGVLQFEVLEHRLKTEYGVTMLMDRLPFRYVRWVTKSPVPVEKLKLTSTSGRAFDSEEREVLLFENEWSIRLAMENNEGLELAETAVRSAYA